MPLAAAARSWAVAPRGWGQFAVGLSASRQAGVVPADWRVSRDPGRRQIGTGRLVCGTFVLLCCALHGGGRRTCGCCHAYSNCSASSLDLKPATISNNSHGRPRLVLSAPPTISPLCFLSRRLGVGE
eukprot:scaffold78386_cov63-Phaeocystis_antarctica.AAC.4